MNEPLEQTISFFSPQLLWSFVIIAAMGIIFFMLRMAYNRLKRHLISSGEDIHDSNRLRVVRTVHTVIRYVLLVVCVLLVLDINGIDITALATAAGVAGIVLGFALQDVLSDLAMGLRIVTDSYFHVGNVIRVNGIEGTVLNISPQSTKIVSRVNNSIHTISNRLLTNVEVLDTMVDLDVSLSYDLTVAEAAQIMDEAATEICDIEDVVDAQFIGTQKFADSGIQYRLRIWCPPAKHPATLREARRVVQDVLERHHAKIPYPQVDVHTK